MDKRERYYYQRHQTSIQIQDDVKREQDYKYNSNSTLNWLVTYKWIIHVLPQTRCDQINYKKIWYLQVQI